MAKIRAFLALNASAAAQSKIAGIIDELSMVKSDVKWEPKDKLHVTLKFLGDVEEPVLKNLAEDLKYELSNFGQFEIRYKTLGCFPNIRLPRVVWVGAEDREKKIFALNKTIEAKAKMFNFENESNRFHPHVTLGRVKGSRGLDEVMEILKTFEFDDIVDTASEVYIMKSLLQKSGSVYSIIDKIIL